MLNSLAIAAAACAAILSAQPAAAASPATTPAASQANTEAEALVRRYFAAIHFERTMDVVQAAMLPVIAEQTAREHPALTDQDREMIAEVVRKVMRDKVMPQMIDRMVPIYAAAFTRDELEAMVAFYESPLGRSITDKAPSLAPKSAQIVRDLMPTMSREVMTEIITKLCPEGKCGAAKSPRSTES
jgi:hypothetical protein